MRLEGPVERSDGLEAGIEGDGQDGHVRLGGIGQRRRRFGQPVAVDEAAEVAMAEPLVDQPAQAIFGHFQRSNQRVHAKTFLAIDLVLLHQPAQPRQQGVFLPVDDGGRLAGLAGLRPACAGDRRTGKRLAGAQRQQGKGRGKPRQYRCLGEPAGGDRGPLVAQRVHEDDAAGIEHGKHRQQGAQAPAALHQIAAQAGHDAPRRQQDEQQGQGVCRCPDPGPPGKESDSPNGGQDRPGHGRAP